MFSEVRSHSLLEIILRIESLAFEREEARLSF